MINMDDHYIRMSEHKELLNREYLSGMLHGFITGIALAVLILVGLYV
jgi:hypothetical protein